MAGTLTVDTIATGTGSTVSLPTVVNGSAKAWVRFNGTLTDISSSMRQFNVSSITDNGTGDYTINFTTPLADGNYSVAGLSQGTAAGYQSVLRFSELAAPTASSLRIFNFFVNTSGAVDATTCSIVVFR